MTRVVLTYDVDSMELSAGETLVGRGLNCQIRFNDPAVSRAHLRFLVDEEGAQVEDLGTTNGTLINGTSFRGIQNIKDGDVIEVGYRQLRVHLVSAQSPDPEAEEQTLTEGAQWVVGRGGSSPGDPATANASTHVAAEQVTLSRGEHWRPGTRQGAPYMADPTTHHCPRCRTRVPYTDDLCPSCGYQWPDGRPSSNTQRIRLEDLNRRASTRTAVEVPVLYSSDTLTFDALARDISRGGMFIATELLDPPGTTCTITVLPDGGSALRLQGVVCHVIQSHGGSRGKPPGIGIRFTELNADSQRWLDGASPAGS